MIERSGISGVVEEYIKDSTTDTISTANSGFSDGENVKGYGYQLWVCS